jgi:hypothetical protein
MTTLDDHPMYDDPERWPHLKFLTRSDIAKARAAAAASPPFDHETLRRLAASLPPVEARRGAA